MNVEHVDLVKHYRAVRARLRRGRIAVPAVVVEVDPKWQAAKDAIAGMSPAHVRRIQTEVCKAHKVSLAEMLSQRRARKLIQARHEAMWRVHHETTLSLPAIGRYFDRDHTSVLYAVRKKCCERDGIHRSLLATAARSINHYRLPPRGLPS